LRSADPSNNILSFPPANNSKSNTNQTEKIKTNNTTSTVIWNCALPNKAIDFKIDVRVVRIVDAKFSGTRSNFWYSFEITQDLNYVLLIDYV
jgi:hypothetical protein